MQTLSDVIQSRGYQFVNEGQTAGIMVSSDKSAMRNLIQQVSKDEDPASLPAKYEATKQWIEMGSEETRRELYRILYAFFFHSLIIMVRKNVDMSIVRKFVDDHMGDHHKYHKQDYAKIQEILRGQISKQIADTMFSLKITQMSFNALTAYLSHMNFSTFLLILDEHFAVEYVPLQGVHYSPDLISEFILPVGASGELTKDIPLNLRKDDVVDLANKYLETLDQRSRANDRGQEQSKQIKYADKKLEIFDDNNERNQSVFKLPIAHVEQIIATATNFVKMARLNKNILPSCAYFTFQDHDTYYDINDDGTLVAVCTEKGITKLISTDAHIDVDDLPTYSQITAKNEPTPSSSFEFINEYEVPRYGIPYDDQPQQLHRKYSYFSRSLIGPRAYFAKFSPSSQFLLTGGAGYVRLWHCEHTGAFSHIYTPSGINWCADWSPCEHQFCIGSGDSNASLWGIDRSKMVRLFVGHQKPVTCCKFHPNSQLIATASLDCTVHLWDIKDGVSVRTFADRTEPPTCLEFTRNGKILITGDEAGSLTAWDLKGDKKLGRIQAHNGPVRDITISVEGNIIATVGSDSEILLWDAESFRTSAMSQAKPLKKLVPRYAETRRAKFSSRNLLLALGSYKGNVN